MANGLTNSLLWKISGRSLPHPCYYFGTMHLMCEDDALLSNAVLSVIEQVAQIYFEIDLKGVQVTPTDDLFTMREAMSISQLLNEKDFLLVENFFNEHMPHSFANLQTMQPLLLTSHVYEVILPCVDKKGIDVKILETAIPLNKTIGGLETMEQQVNLLHQIPYRHQARELYKLIKKLDNYRLLLIDMISYYKSQNIKKLHALATKREAGISEYKSLLLYKRNEKWVDQISSIVAEGPTLFAVGAAHLAGQRGVLNLLKRQGYKVESLTL